MHNIPTQPAPYPDIHPSRLQPHPLPDESAWPWPGQEFAFLCCGALLLACLMALLIAYRRKSRRYTELLDSYRALETRFAQLSNDSERSSAESAYLCDALARQLQRFQELLGKAFKASNQKNFVREFKAHASSIRNDKSLFADLRYMVDKRFGRLAEHLHTAHPDLTEYELDLLCMLRLGFSFDCIRLLHCHENIYSLYSRRTKIHRKLGLPPRLRLEEYLSELGRQSQAGIRVSLNKNTIT